MSQRDDMVWISVTLPVALIISIFVSCISSLKVIELCCLWSCTSMMMLYNGLLSVYVWVSQWVNRGRARTRDSFPWLALQASR